ncbi:hypothetical protein F5B21DRAFT_517174 [Xylaria acuta]|nr:hypothetical protein F5B21DRAFT_517174 [Xylaria acuta]
MAIFRCKTPRYFVPARNSRHRTACLALYRALLRLAPQVSLPHDLATGWGPGKNPIAVHIQRAFRRNVADTSPRIVHPALSAGYRMLSVLHDAATSPSSTHRASIVTFLQSRLAERQRSLANRPPPPTGPKPGAPRAGTLPLLAKVSPAPSASNPHPRPRYATPHRPRPQAELGGTGRRKIPRLDLASDFPFLRLTKPEPALLSRVLRQKMAKRFARMESLIDLKEAQLPAAELEDEWDAAMARLMRAEEEGDEGDEGEEGGEKGEKGEEEKEGEEDSPPQRKGKRKKRPRKARNNTNPERLAWEDERDVGVGGGARDGRSHVHAVRRYGIADVGETMTRERNDQIARADAMRRLIIQEKALAAAEKERRTAEKRARWEARMLMLHGETWRDSFPNLKESEPSSRPL